MITAKRPSSGSGRDSEALVQAQEMEDGADHAEENSEYLEGARIPELQQLQRSLPSVELTGLHDSLSTLVDNLKSFDSSQENSNGQGVSDQAMEQAAEQTGEQAANVAHEQTA